MSEDRTKDLKNAKSLEDRVFARFEGMEIRITNLEDRQYDTKPIWERALAEISDTNRRIGELTAEIRASNEALRNEFSAANQQMRSDLRFEFLTGNEAVRNDLRSEFQSGMEALRTEMKAEFATFRHEMEHGLCGIARTLTL